MPYLSQQWWNIGTWTLIVAEAILTVTGTFRIGVIEQAERDAVAAGIAGEAEIAAAATASGRAMLVATALVALLATGWVLLAPRLSTDVAPITRWILLAQAPAALVLVAGVLLSLPGDNDGQSPSNAFGSLYFAAVAQAVLAGLAAAALWFAQQSAMAGPGDPLQFRARLQLRRVLVTLAAAGYLLLTAWLCVTLTLTSLFMGFVAAPLALIGIAGALPLLMGLTSAAEAIDPDTSQIALSMLDRAWSQLLVAVAVLGAGLVATVIWPPVAAVLWPAQAVLVAFTVGEVVSLHRFRAALNHASV